MKPTACPECKVGKVYLSKEVETGITVGKCFACGFYWHDGNGYSELDRRLFKEHFPTRKRWEASPAVGQPFTSPDRWTEPKLRR